MTDNQDSPQLLAWAADQINAGIVVIDANYTIESWNRFMEIHSTKPTSEVLGKNLFETFPELPRVWLEKKIKSVILIKNLSFTSWEQRPYLFKFPNPRFSNNDEEHMLQNCTFSPVVNSHGSVEHVCLTIFDATDIATSQNELKHTAETLALQKEEQKQLIVKLEEAQNQLLQSEKMAAIGQLAAGVAHEINNPIGYVASNIGSLDGYINDLLLVIDECEKCSADMPSDSETRTKLEAVKKKVDLKFLKDDVFDLIGESKEGIGRVKKIVQDLKDFSHVDSNEWQETDLHAGLDSTLNVVSNEIRYKAEVVKKYGEIPSINCLSSQINQVLMNLLVNAAHAIEGSGIITIETGSEDDGVWVKISDTGCGIPEDKIHRIFEPFYTSKPVGKGTGLGLSLSYGIVSKHHGKLTVESTVGEGTCFRLWLPIKHDVKDEASPA